MKKWDFSFNFQYWINAGAPKEKIHMGIPLYGRGFELEQPEENGLYCPADDGIPKGPYTRQKAIWSYQEILQAQNNETLINLPGAVAKDWTVVVDDCAKAPYMCNYSTFFQKFPNLLVGNTDLLCLFR